MTEKELTEEIFRIIRDHFRLGTDYKILLTSNLEKDFQADELDIVEITMEIEDEFGTNIADKIADKWKVVNDIFLYLCKRLEVEKEFNPINNRFEILDL